MLFPGHRIFASIIGVAVIAALLTGCSSKSSEPPASSAGDTPEVSAEQTDVAVSASGLTPIAGADLSRATADLAGLVGSMNDAEAALVRALDEDHTAADLMTLQQELASRSLNVGRLADLLADTAGRRDDPAAAATAAMYTNVAEVSYALALTVSVTTPADLLDPEMATGVQTGLADAWLALSTGDPAHQDVFRDVLGDEYPDDLVEVEVEGDDLPQVAVFASEARDSMETELAPLLTLLLPDSGTEAALNAAIDPRSAMSLQELAGVAAARLSLFAQPAPQASLAPNLQAQSLSFSTARRIVMSPGHDYSNTQALRTFVTLADPEDFASFWAFHEGKQADGKDISSMILDVAVDSFRGRDDRPDLKFLADLLQTAGPGELAAKYPDLAAKVQRVLFEEYVAGDEPAIALASAHYDRESSTIVLAVSYGNPGPPLLLICEGLDTNESIAQIPKGSGKLALVMRTTANPRDYNHTEYYCRTKYGQAFNGDVGLNESAPTDTPAPEHPTSTPVPPPPAQQSEPTATEECIASSDSATGLFSCQN
jgi:hypothetical protein